MVVTAYSQVKRPAYTGRGTPNDRARLGVILLVAGVLGLGGYSLFYVSRAFFGSPHVPIAVKAAVSVVPVGVAVMLGALLVERLRRQRHEQFKEVEY